MEQISHSSPTIAIEGQTLGISLIILHHHLVSDIAHLAIRIYFNLKLPVRKSEANCNAAGGKSPGKTVLKSNGSDTVNNLFGFASPFANQYVYQPPANQCNIWFAETANQHVGQGTGLYVY